MEKDYDNDNIQHTNNELPKSYIPHGNVPDLFYHNGVLS